MAYETDERLKSYLDTNQLSREQLCQAVLALDKRFTDVEPRHPRGGPDGGRDLQALFNREHLAFAAVGFLNQANDSSEQKRRAVSKFEDDLAAAVSSEPAPRVFVFFTNTNLTVGEKDACIEKAKKAGLFHSEIFDRERIRIHLDSADGLAARFQYLGMPLSDAEQAAFFGRWGSEIQSVISTGFQRAEKTLNRLLFLQESLDAIVSLVVVLNLDREYQGDEIGPFRVFCDLVLKEPKHEIMAILFGACNGSRRFRHDSPSAASSSKWRGIKFGVSGAQWHWRIPKRAHQESLSKRRTTTTKPEYKKVGSYSAVGQDSVRSIRIAYSNNGLIRFVPSLTIRDLDDAMFVVLLNKSLALKTQSISVYANGYKLHEVPGTRLCRNDRDSTIPTPLLLYTEEELCDPWVCLHPDNATAFCLSFFDQTPVRTISYREVSNEANNAGEIRLPNK